MFLLSKTPDHRELGITIQCVYSIIDTLGSGWREAPGWMYIGSTVDAHRRWRQHDWALRNGQHHCSYLQEECKGIDERRFRFVVLEEVDDQRSLREREKWWRQRATCCYDREEGVMRRQFPSLFK